MTAQRAYQAVLIHLEQEIDGFVGAAFVDVETGRALAAHCVRPEFSLEALGAFGSELAKAARRHFETAAEEREPEETLVTIGGQLQIHHMVSRGVMLCVAAARAETSLALVRTITHQRALVLASDATLGGVLAPSGGSDGVAG